MGFLDHIKAAFGGAKGHKPKMGEPMTLTQAKAALADEVSGQPLADMRRTAERVKQLNDEMPYYVTFAMSYYCDSTRLVRFTNNGGMQMDADRTAALYGQTTVLQDERVIQKHIGNLYEMRERLDPSDIGSTDPAPLAAITAEATAAGGERLHSWLFALLDQAADIAEATGGNVAPIIAALPALGEEAVPEADLHQAVVARLWPDPSQIPAAIAHPDTPSTDYLQAHAILTA